MSTKSKTTKGKKIVPPNQKYKPITKDLADHGHTASRILWWKILASATPEVRGMLLAHTHLELACQAINPEDYTKPQVKHDTLLEYVHKAEEFLHGVTDANRQEVFGY